MDDKSYIELWNQWQKRNMNSSYYKLLVLLGIVHSPTFEMYYIWPSTHKEKEN